MDRRALLFTHPLFELHPLSFFAFRVFRSAFGIVLGIAVMVGLFSRVPFLFWGSLLVCVVSLEGTLFRALPRTPSRFRGRETPIQLAHRLSPWLLDRLPLVLLRAHIGASPIFFHLIAELVHSRDVQSLLARLGTDAAEFAAKARERIQDEAGERLGSNGENRRALRILIEEAFRIAEANGSPLIAPAHLFAAARRRASLRPSVARFFAFFEIEDEYLSLLTLLGEAPRGDRRPAFFVEELYAFARNALTAPIISFGRAFSRPTPTLRRFGAELPSSRRAARVARLVGHAPEWEELLQTLSLKRSRLAVLVGPPHSGRGALVERLARSARDQGSPAHLAGCRFFRFDLIRLIQQKTPREVRALSDALAGELERSAESVVVYFSAIEHLFALSLEMRTALEALVSLLLSGRVRAIASLDAAHVRRFSDHPLLRGARTIRMTRLSRADFLEFLFLLGGDLEWLHGVTISLDALIGAASLDGPEREESSSPHVATRLLTQAILSLIGRGRRTLTAHDLLLEVRRQSLLPPPRASFPLTRAPAARRLSAALGGRSESLGVFLRLLSSSRESFDARVFPPLLLVNFSDERSERIAGLLASFCFGSRSRVLTFQLAGRSDGGSARLAPLELFLNKLLHASLGEAGSVFFFPHLDRAPRELLTPLRELARSGVFADETRQGAEAGMIDARHALILGSVTLDGTGGGDLSAEELLEASLPGEMVREFIHLFASV